MYLWLSQTVLDSANFGADSTNFVADFANCLFWSDFKQYIDLAICLWNPKQQEDQRKVTRLWIPRQI